MPLDYLPPPAASLNASSANAAAANNQTFAAAAGKTNYVSGFEITGGGATAGSVITVTLAGVLGGTQQYKFAVPTGAAVGAAPLVVKFDPPLPATGENVAIDLAVPSFGAGNTAAAVAMHGFRI